MVRSSGRSAVTGGGEGSMMETAVIYLRDLKNCEGSSTQGEGPPSISTVLDEPSVTTAMEVGSTGRRGRYEEMVTAASR